jgi:chromosome segregation ATPase
VTTKQDSASVNRQWDTSKALKSADSKTNTMASKTRTTAGFQMSASVAQSLASKLLPAELSAIIAMRDQLRKKEEELQKIQEDVIDLTAQLEGTISVKDVLASKLKELQKKVQSDEEISAKMTRQVASDQEVIAFLDERVQELEKAVDNFHLERTKANKAIEKVKDASERQVAVLSDMLTYEREQRSDQEKEWKNTKKVLIKEVKLCRAQIMALEAERDGFREENQRLKEALMARARGAGRSFDAIMS